MKNFSCFRKIFIFVIVVSIGSAGFSPANAEAKPLKCDDIQRIRVLGANNHPVKVLVVLTRMTNNLGFVAKLVKIVAKIHEQDKLSPEESFKVTIFPSDINYYNELIKSVGADIAKRYVEKGNGYPSSDPWIQDWGEIAMVQTSVDPKPQLMILDSNRGQELSVLPQLLAKLWNAYILKNPSNKMAAGDNGGNIEVTPDDILILGNTVTDEFKSFLERRGYKNRIALVETDWLVVGHCDEYISVVPNDQAKEGFTIIKADPRKALELLRATPRKELEKLKDSGYKTTLLLIHDNLQDDKVHPNYEKYGLNSKTSVKNLIDQNKALSIIIDDNVKKICGTINRVNKLGSRAHSVMSFPMLFYNYHARNENNNTGNEINLKRSFLALTPGTVNQLILRKHLIVPDPMINSFRESIKAVAEKLGLKVHFLDDFMYHQKMGDIHCGTNVFRNPNKYVVKPKHLPEWWEPKTHH